MISITNSTLNNTVFVIFIVMVIVIVILFLFLVMMKLAVSFGNITLRYLQIFYTGQATEQFIW